MEHREQESRDAARRTEIARRTFMQRILAAAAVTSAYASAVPPPTVEGAELLPTGGAGAFRVLTADQGGLLAAALNRIIPPNGLQPGAGDVGIATFIDGLLGEAPHLRPHVVGLVTHLGVAGARVAMSDAEWDQRLQQLQEDYGASFEILLQATYVGYYSDPGILAAIGWIEPNDHEYHVERFRYGLLDEVRARGPMFVDG